MNHVIQFDIIMNVRGLMGWRQMRFNVQGGHHDNAFGYVMSHYASPQESFAGGHVVARVALIFRTMGMLDENYRD